MTNIKKVNNKIYERIPIKTKILTENDNIIAIVKKYTKKYLQKGDIIVISESPVAMTQGRAVFEKDIKVGFLAGFLWRYVSKNKYGIGLRAASSMQCAVDECGSLRILIAAFIGFLGKLFGKKGWFYKVAGKQAALIDAAHTSFIPPYDKTVIKGPLHTDEICKKLKSLTNNETAIMDINDIGGSWIIGASSGINKDLLEEIMDDNPQGQKSEQTPICIVREKK